MDVIPIHQIIISPNRQRREFNEQKLKALAASIARTGLMHPIVLESRQTMRLVAGERRIRAIERFVTEPYTHNLYHIQPHNIPIVFLGDLPDLAREEAELEENTIREDLSWQEHNSAIARLHELRAKQAATVGKKQTFTATAEEIKGGEASAVELVAVRNATLLHPFLSDPVVAGAATEREALSIVRKKLAQTFTNSLAQRFDITKGQNTHTLIHGDCTAILPTLTDSFFDVIIVDPPYGIDAHKMAPMSGSESGVVHEYEDTFENAYQIWLSIFVEGARICKPQAHLYMFCDIRHFTTITSFAKAAGWDVWPTPIIWHKPGGGMLGDSTRGPRRSYETILYARRGDKRVTGVYIDVIVEAGADAAAHAAAKPISVYTNLLRRSTAPGDKVLDPCAGSGTIFPAANRLRLVATGIEKSSTHYATCTQRINE